MILKRQVINQEDEDFLERIVNKSKDLSARHLVKIILKIIRIMEGDVR